MEKSPRSKEVEQQLNESEPESDESDTLRISLTPVRPPVTRANKLKRKRKQLLSDDELPIDKAIEEKLQSCAKKNNLTPAEMKKLLRSVVKNDHVLALVKIQEEVELAREKDPSNKTNDGQPGSDDKGDKDGAPVPKFTRSTARALNKKPLPLSALSEIQLEPEIAALISDELHSDEEDEEYEPKEEDYASDDDPNTTISDIDSQPCTPKTPATHHEVEDDLNRSQYTDDGLFKVPRQRTDSTASHHEEIIAKRTRSKVCLQETPIEAIESNFIPPDIPTDMYDFDAEIDNAWVEFLTNFSKPLNTDVHPEEDDEADPEYVAADHEPIDSEELRNVNISKKELSDLVAELFDGLVQEGVILEDIQLGTPKKSFDKSPQKKKAKADSKSELNSPIHDISLVQSSIQSNQTVTTPSKYMNESSSQINETSSQITSMGSNIGTSFSQQISADKMNATIREESQLNATRMNQTLFSPNIMSTPMNITNKTAQFAPNIQQPNVTPITSSVENVQQQLVVAEIVESDSAIGSQTGGRVMSSNGPIQVMLASNDENQSGIITLMPITLAYASPAKNVLTVLPITGATNSLIATSLAATSTSTKSSDAVVAMNSGSLVVVDSSQSSVISTSKTTNMVSSITITDSPKAQVEPLSQNASKGANVESSTANAIVIQQPSGITANLTKSSENRMTTPNSTTTISQTATASKTSQIASSAEPAPKKYPTKALGITANSYTLSNSGTYRNKLKKNYKEKYEKLKEIQVPEEPEFDPNQTGFTITQRKIMEQQLRMHVQLIAQNFLQVYSHPIFWKYGTTQKNMLMELDKHHDITRITAFNIWNLKLAVRLITDWEKDLSINNAENTALMEFIYNEIDKAKKRACVQRFPARIMRQIIRSPVFIYGHLLPEMPFRPTEPSFNEMVPSTDQLLAHSLYYTYKDLEEYERKIRPTNPRKVPLAKVVRYISVDGVHGKNVAGLCEYISRKMKAENYNPIKFYFEHKKPPPYKHILYELDFEHMLRPEDRLSQLPMIWQEFGVRLRALEIERTCHPYRYTRAVNSVRDYNEPAIDVIDLNLGHKTQNTSNITIQVNCVYDSSQNSNSTQNSILHNDSIHSYNVAPSYDPRPPVIAHHSQQTHQATNYETSYNQTISQSNFSYFTQIHEPLPSLRGGDPLDIYKFSRNFESSTDSRASSASPAVPEYFETCHSEPQVLANTACTAKTTERQEAAAEPPLPKGQKLVTDYFKVQKKDADRVGVLSLKKRWKHVKARRRRNVRKQRKFFKNLLQRQRLRKKQLKRKVFNLLIVYQETIRRTRDPYKNPLLNRVFRQVKALELYTGFLTALEMNVKKMKSMEDCSAKKSATGKSLGDDETPKTRKPYRVGESLRQMLLPESKEDTNEKDATFAMNFFDKVEETFCSANQHERYESFQKILKNFDPQKDRVTDLYYKMESLFLPEYPHLAEIFLAFLLPSEAIEIGKFFEHFMITNMGNFINKLNIFFNKQPAQIKKIYGALSELAEEQDVGMEQVKNKILPLLKGNKFLVDWFLQTFETEKPNQSISNIYETINLKQVESQQGEAEIYETVQQKDIVEESTDTNSCQLKYINGGIYYGSRILLPAKLSFLATELSKGEEDEATSPEVDDRLTGTSKSCVHGIRECAERQLKSHLEKCDEEKRSEDDDEKDKDKYTLCDDNTFKAHAARLNPALYHVPQHLHINTCLKSKSSEGEISPKKQCLQKRRSPKKSMPKSPTATNKKSASIPESSKALGIAKKLKSMTTTGEAEPNVNLKSRRKQPKASKSISITEPLESLSGSNTASDGTVSDSDRSSCEPKRKQSKLQNSPAPRTDELQQQQAGPSTSICSQVETLSPSPTPNIVEDKMPTWTRDEDKIILEEVKSGYDNENALVSRLLLKLPNRNVLEITKRHQFLMEVLTRLQGKAS